MMYLKRLLIVSVITCVVAYTAGLILDTSYKKRWDILWFQKSDELIKSNKQYDVIFLGNSRAHFGINPFYIDSVTKLNSYNFGNGGADAEEIMLTAELYLQNHPPPSIVIISLDPGMITGNEILKTRFHYLFYLENVTIQKYMKQAGFFTALIRIFPFTKYSFFDEYNRTSLFMKGKKYPAFDHNIYKGFLNIHQTINSPLTPVYNVKKGVNNLSDAAIRYFKNTVTLFQQKGSMVVFVSPPLRSIARNVHTPYSKAADSTFTNIANEYHIQHLHFENDNIYTDEYFVDDIHMNEPGTKIYSLQLADTVKFLLPVINKNQN